MGIRPVRWAAVAASVIALSLSGVWGRRGVSDDCGGERAGPQDPGTSTPRTAAPWPRVEKCASAPRTWRRTGIRCTSTVT